MNFQQNVLIHPDGPSSHDVWEAHPWTSSECKVLLRGDDLEDIDYARAEVPEGSTIVLGGQMVDGCVYLHAMTLITDPEVIQRNIEVVLAGNALRGNVAYAIAAIQKRTGQVLRVIDCPKTPLP